MYNYFAERVLIGSEISWSLIYAFSLFSLCNPFRSAWPAERETHRAASGDSASFVRAPTEAQPSRLPAAVRQAAPEDDGPPPDCHRPCAPHRAAKEDRGGHAPAPSATGDNQGLVLGFKRKRGQAWNCEEKRKDQRWLNNELK